MLSLMPGGQVQAANALDEIEANFKINWLHVTSQSLKYSISLCGNCTDNMRAPVFPK